MSGVIERWSRAHPCPICGGDPTQRSGKGVRCWGYATTSAMGRRWAYCTREEFSGGAPFNANAHAYRHLLTGPCACGLSHGFLAQRIRCAISRCSKKAGPRLDPLDPDTLDQVYRAYLDLTPLRPEHRDFYARRGAADLAVAQAHGYGSLPFGYREARRVVDALVSRFGIEIMRRVPGFYLSKKDGRLLTHTARADADAAVIVGRDELGRISVLQRHTTAGSNPKYMNFAGGSNRVYTVAGGAPPTGPRQIMLVEGLHKAHTAAHHATGVVFVGMIGAAINDAHLGVLERLRPDVVIETLDADKDSNPNVGRQQATIHQKLLGAAWIQERRVEVVSAV